MWDWPPSLGHNYDQSYFYHQQCYIIMDCSGMKIKSESGKIAVDNSRYKTSTVTLVVFKDVHENLDNN
jgi:hypothetical protein